VQSGRGEQTALIYDSPVTGTVKSFTYRPAPGRGRKVRGSHRSLGVEQGDRVIIYMPMVPEAVIAMLAVARLGAIHSVVFGGFASPRARRAHRRRQAQAGPDGLCGVEPADRFLQPLLDAAIDLATHKPAHCIVYQRPMERAQMRPAAISIERDHGERGPHDCVPVRDRSALHPVHVRHHRPAKGIVRDNGATSSRSNGA